MLRNTYDCGSPHGNGIEPTWIILLLQHPICKIQPAIISKRLEDNGSPCEAGGNFKHFPAHEPIQSITRSLHMLLGEKSKAQGENVAGLCIRHQATSSSYVFVLEQGKQLRRLSGILLGFLRLANSSTYLRRQVGDVYQVRVRDQKRVR